MSGFSGLRAAIEEIVADMGGGSLAREAIGQEFSEFLRLTMPKPARDEDHYGYAQWYEASEADMTVATQRALEHFRRSPDEEVSAQAPFPGRPGSILVFETRTQLVTPKGFHIALVSFFESSTYSRRTHRTEPDFMISVDESGKLLSKGMRPHHYTSQSATHAKSKAGAYKAMRKMIETRFGVSLENRA